VNSLPELEIAECEVPHIPCGLALVNITIAIGGMAMNRDKIWESVSRIYDQVEIALWALLLSGTIFFLAFTVPKLPQILAQVETIRSQEIAAENSRYCEKLGMTAGTQKDEQCLLTLGEFRLKVEKRIAAEQDF
jgi:hypothetical protein